MNILSCLDPSRTLASAQASSKKRAFEIISELFANSCQSVSEQDVLDSLFARERLGSTAMGGGIAIPHGRCNSCQGAICAVVMLETGIDYNATDKQPVDILFAVMVPEQAHDEHIECLSSIANLLKQESFSRQIRNAYNNQALYDIVKAAVEKQSAKA
ncbi:PTS sugar transporter subunit IIA [Pleionea mediterranea]|jgi:PTS system nitrogen regulatory IIA component|uniref:Phosphotransferase IIA-like nitrogen-regulatory protein PtsN n=1 Tax=Pleionea mediterranea TaxID=523701 RepID=A0A316FJ34_9GAMM|nr:PTS sugar transporter subunit IIA [Pleionea mediterranea]PWK47800.1 phosphotransferase IIA-like nitrogen-regulatory protein PtsN [Pleionea mediterranea]